MSIAHSASSRRNVATASQSALPTTTVSSPRKSLVSRILAPSCALRRSTTFLLIVIRLRREHRVRLDLAIAGAEEILHRHLTDAELRALLADALLSEEHRRALLA